jgi:hypothetical protein
LSDPINLYPVVIWPNYNPTVKQRAVTPISQTRPPSAKAIGPFISASVEFNLLVKKVQVGGVKAPFFQALCSSSSVSHRLWQVGTVPYSGDEVLTDTHSIDSV